jgi:hypothetical protein
MESDTACSATLPPCQPSLALGAVHLHCQTAPVTGAGIHPVGAIPVATWPLSVSSTHCRSISFKLLPLCTYCPTFFGCAALQANAF